jgi:hypothetical protein
MNHHKWNFDKVKNKGCGWRNLQGMELFLFLIFLKNLFLNARSKLKSS